MAAALAATDRGYRVILTDEFDWIGGQVTSQALCVLDELYDPTGETIMNAAVCGVSPPDARALQVAVQAFGAGGGAT